MVKFKVSIFVLSLELFMSHLRWLCLTQCHGNLLVFFSKSFFIVLPLTFRFIIHLESIFVYSVRNGFNFTFFTWPSSCSSTICWKDYSPLNCYGMHVKKLIHHKCLGLFLGFQFYSIDLYVILMSVCYFCFCCSVAKSDSLWPHRLKHTRLLCPPLSPRICSSSCPLRWWCYLTISFAAAFFFCPQSFPALGSFPISQLFKSGGQSIGASASASVLPMNIQG